MGTCDARTWRCGPPDALSDRVSPDRQARELALRRSLEAVRRAKDGVGHLVKIEVEVDDLAQLEELLAVGADVVLLDNMEPDTLAEAVRRVDGAMVTEASGGVTLETVRAKAEAGVDLISVGWLTHSAPTLDLGLDAD